MNINEQELQYEVIKLVKNHQNTGYLYLPKWLIGRKVKVELIGDEKK